MSAPAFSAPSAAEALGALPHAVWTVDRGGRVTGANAAWARVAAALDAPAARAALARALDAARAAGAPARCDVPAHAGTSQRVEVAPLADGACVCTAVEDAGAPAPGPAPQGPDPLGAGRPREALVDAGIALARTLDLEHVYREAARQARSVLGATAFAIAAADDDTAALRLTHRAGWPGASDDALERRLAPAWLEALATGRVIAREDDEFTAPVATPDGALGAMTARVPPPRDAGAVARLLETLAAQTAAAVERAWLVRRVEQKRRLEAIGEVAAGVAHELRNPLFGISSAAQLLALRAGGDPVVERNVGRILREAERLNRIIGALLEYGRPPAARLAPGDPDLVWDDVLDAERARLDAKRLTLRRERAAGSATGGPAGGPAGGAPAGGAWRFDADQLRQVFLNLLTNAADAAPEGGALALAAAALPGGGWRCQLHNGGPAIPPESLVRVFELFYSTKAGGTGIGLALSQRILDEHGGAIAVESAPEAGTTVTVTLPAA